MLVSTKRDFAATRRFFTQALQHGPPPTEVTTDRASAYPRVLDELLPAACHITEQYANNPVDADHGRLKARLRPMRGLYAPLTWSALDTRLCRTCAAVTTNSAWISTPASTPDSLHRTRICHLITASSRLNLHANTQRNTAPGGGGVACTPVNAGHPAHALRRASLVAVAVIAVAVMLMPVLVAGVWPYGDRREGRTRGA